MKNYLMLFFLLISMQMIGQERLESWMKDYDAVTKIARSENKHILVYFAKNDCSDCEQFYKNMFETGTLNDLSTRFVLLELDGSGNKLQTLDKEIVRKRRMVMHLNKTDSYPALLVLDSEAKAIGDLFVSNDKNAMEGYRTYLKSL